MRATIIAYNTPELLYRNTVCHECTCGEFLQDIKAETKRYLKEQGLVSDVDVYWHLDEYCEKKYGACHWQMVSVRSLLLAVAIPAKDKES